MPRYALTVIIDDILTPIRFTIPAENVVDEQEAEVMRFNNDIANALVSADARVSIKIHEVGK